MARNSSRGDDTTAIIYLKLPIWFLRLRNTYCFFSTVAFLDRVELCDPWLACNSLCGPGLYGTGSNHPSVFQVQHCRPLHWLDSGRPQRPTDFFCSLGWHCQRATYSNTWSVNCNEQITSQLGVFFLCKRYLSLPTLTHVSYFSLHTVSRVPAVPVSFGTTQHCKSKAMSPANMETSLGQLLQETIKNNN